MATVGAVCAAALVLSACGSDDEESGGGGAGGGGTLDIGVLTSLSGPNAPAATSAVRGVQARFDAYEETGEGCAGDVDFNIVEGDDASSPQGALAAVQGLVQQDEVFSLITLSPMFFGATAFMTTQGSTVPVFGGGWDGAQEWYDTDDNMFLNFPVPSKEGPYTTTGDFFTSQGVTTVAGVTYNQAAAQDGLNDFLASSEAAGLSIGYVNDSLQFGDTNVGPLVLGILDSGADAVFSSTNFDTSLALVSGLRQAGWDGMLVSPTGYGADLLGSQPAVEAGQGVVFQSNFAPVELNTDAGNEMKTALQAAGNESGIPGYYESQGWFGADLFLHGLEEAGCDAGQEELISTMQENTDWDANGLFPQPIPQTTTEFDEQCFYMVTLEGETFVPIEGADPICGGHVDS